MTDKEHVKVGNRIIHRNLLLIFMLLVMLMGLVGLLFFGYMLLMPVG